MKLWIAFFNILLKDAKTYYLKPPNISWGILFPLVWTGMFFIKTGNNIENLITVLPGVIGVAVMFGTTSMLSVTIVFEKKNKSLERLLLAPIPLDLIILSKTSGAILFGIFNAFIPILISIFIIDLSHTNWFSFTISVILTSITSTFLAFLISLIASEVFEAQTFSNFFRFPMLFLCGLFFPIEKLPSFLQPFSYILPLTYGTDLLRSSLGIFHRFSSFLSFIFLLLYSLILFLVSRRLVKKTWII